MKGLMGAVTSTILVTGGAGFIGSNYIHYLLDQDSDVQIINLDKLTYAGNLDNLKSLEDHPRYRFIYGDICDRVLVEKIFSNHDIQSVVNFAAESHVDRSIEDPEIFVRTNVLGTMTLLDMARRHWADGEGFQTGKKFVQISTDEVYGTLGDSGYFTEETPLDPHSPYSASKAGADLIVKSYFDTYGFPANITRCSNNYGPYQFPEKLIPFMISKALHHENLPVYGDGLNIRDWLFVMDHCSAIELVRTKGQPGKVYNIGGNNEMTNISLVKLILNKFRENADASVSEELIQFVKDRKGHDRRYAIDSSRIRAELGWRPATSFEDGIRETIHWYLNNLVWLKRILSGEYAQSAAGSEEKAG